MRAAVLAVMLIGCARPPVSPQVDEMAQLRAESAELHRILTHVCEQGCETDVLKECVVESVELPNPDENCIHDRALACLINCAP